MGILMPRDFVLDFVLNIIWSCSGRRKKGGLTHRVKVKAGSVGIKLIQLSRTAWHLTAVESHSPLIGGKKAVRQSGTDQ